MSIAVEDAQRFVVGLHNAVTETVVPAAPPALPEQNELRIHRLIRDAETSAWIAQEQNTYSGGRLYANARKSKWLGASLGNIPDVAFVTAAFDPDSDVYRRATDSMIWARVETLANDLHLSGADARTLSRAVNRLLAVRCGLSPPRMLSDEMAF
jgi:hypothetical protein